MYDTSNYTISMKAYLREKVPSSSREVPSIYHTYYSDSVLDTP